LLLEKTLVTKHGKQWQDFKPRPLLGLSIHRLIHMDEGLSPDRKMGLTEIWNRSQLRHDCAWSCLHSLLSL